MTTSKQQAVIITGASSGIGEATARLLVERGDRVLMVGRSAERLEAARLRVGATGPAILSSTTPASAGRVRSRPCP